MQDLSERRLMVMKIESSNPKRRTVTIDDAGDSLFTDPQRTWALLRLCLVADSQGQVTTSVRALADAWGWSRDRTAEVLRELAAGGWIQKVRQTRRACYQLSGRGLRPDGLEPGVTDLTPPEPENATATEAKRLVARHIEQYTARFGQPFPVAWARDTQVYKRLVRVYGSDSAFLETLQDRFFKQSLDSFAGKRGFSVLQFAAECAGLAAQAGAQALWSVEQTEAFHALRQVGMSESTATALISECSLAVIHAQIAAYERRIEHGQAVSLSRLERAIRENWQEKAEPVDYPAFPAKPTRPDGAESPSDEPNSTPALAEFLSAIAMKV